MTMMNNRCNQFVPAISFDNFLKVVKAFFGQRFLGTANHREGDYSHSVVPGVHKRYFTTSIHCPFSTALTDTSYMASQVVAGR